MPRKKKPLIEYRHYSLPINFPILLLSGERWKISDIKSEHLHFHNHLEFGICHSDSGIMEIKGESVPFKAGDVTFIPRYVMLRFCKHQQEGSVSFTVDEVISPFKASAKHVGAEALPYLAVFIFKYPI